MTAEQISVTRRIPFCAGHRVVGHETKCAHVHGHNWVAFITCVPKGSGDDLDAIGRVVDYGVVKIRVKGWIDQQWDHAMIVNPEDEDLCAFLEAHAMRHHLLFVDGKPANPTSENLARVLLVEAQRLLDGMGVRVLCVRIEETENCYAEAWT